MRVVSCFVLLATFLFAVPGGEYAGTWTSDNGASSGKVNVVLSGSGEGDLSFTYQDQVMKPKKVTAKVTDNQVEFICDLDFDGLKLKNIFAGTISGKEMSGKYRSTSAEDGSIVDSGTWKVTQQ